MLIPSSAFETFQQDLDHTKQQILADKRQDLASLMIRIRVEESLKKKRLDQSALQKDHKTRSDQLNSLVAKENRNCGGSSGKRNRGLKTKNSFHMSKVKE